MGCAGCSVKATSKDGTPQGCRSNGSCGTSGCNRMNTYDWLATMDIQDVNPFDLVEVSSFPAMSRYIVARRRG